MARILAPRRPLVAAVLFGTFGVCGLAAAAAPARAQSSVTVNFDTLTVTDGSGVRYVDNCYRESGFLVAAVGLRCGTASTFATAGADDPQLWTGSPALFLNDATASTVRFSRVDDGLFSMQSIGLASFLNGAGTVMLTGYLMDGGTVAQTCNVPAGDPNPFALQQPIAACTLGSMFSGLTSVEMTASDTFGEPIAEFDNLVFTPSASTTTPEPATVALVGGGLLAVAAAARRRRARS